MPGMLGDFGRADGGDGTLGSFGAGGDRTMGSFGQLVSIAWFHFEATSRVSSLDEATSVVRGLHDATVR